MAGLKPLKHDRRDYSFFKRPHIKAALGAVTPSFPHDYSTDVGLWMPDQNADGQPFGCTNYAQSDLMIDEDHKLYDPKELEAITHANALGGIDLRTSFKAVVQLHPDHPQFFVVKPDAAANANSDYFDAVRLAIVIGKAENRAVSIGTPWYPQWCGPNVPSSGVLTPVLRWDWLSGHNWTAKGWVTVNGVCYLIVKSWQGTHFGNAGYAYISRAVFNKLMSVSGSAAFVLDKLLPGEVPTPVGWSYGWGTPITQAVKDLFVAFFSALFKGFGHSSQERP